MGKLPWSTMKGRDDEKGMTLKINMIKKRLNFGKLKQGIFAEISDSWVLIVGCVCVFLTFCPETSAQNQDNGPDLILFSLQFTLHTNTTMFMFMFMYVSV